MADQYVIRPISDDEYAAFRRVHDHSFNSGPAPAARWPRLRRQFEAERSLAAFDPGLPAGVGLVGTTGVYSFQMAVPGAVFPVAGVTAVSVLPTHRRRGILRSLMSRQIADIAARGEEPIAALWASETPLYGRYGYGRASSNASFRFGRGEGALSALAPVDPGLTLRLAEPGEAAADLAKVYDTVLSGQPGFFTRDEDWWERVLDDPADERRGASPLRCVLATGDDGVRGYSLYRSTARWEEGTVLPDGAIDVWELIAADPAASAALWRDLLSRDLVTSVTADLRPADDPLLYQLHDSAPGPGAGGRQPLGADHRSAGRARPPRLLLAGRCGARGHRRAAAGQRGPLAAAGGRARRRRRLRADGRAGRHRAGRQGARRGLSRRHPARRAGRGRPGRRAAAGRGGQPLHRHELGSCPVVPPVFCRARADVDAAVALSGE